MPLPVEGKPWPSPEWAPAFDQFAENSAWFSADQEALADIYGGGGYSRGDNPAAHYNRADNTWRSGGLRGRIYQFFAGKVIAGAGGVPSQQTRIVSPIVGNIATLSADKLMGVPPTFRLEQDGGDVAQDRQQRVDDMLASDEFRMRLAQAAEYAAGLSAVVLTAHWGDRSTSDRPWIQTTACDAAVPEYEGGRLIAVNLWTTYPTTDAGGVLGKVYYHVERHEIGAVVHALYEGKTNSIGKLVPIDRLDHLAYLGRIPGSYGDGEILFLPTGIEQLTAMYWINRPTRRFRSDGRLGVIGRSDVEGAEPFADAHSFTWSSWIRDLKIARARLIVPESMLAVQSEGAGGLFDDDAEVITALNYVKLNGSDDKISAQQFAIRAEEHGATLLGITKELLQHAGYSLSSYGEFAGGPSITATEIHDRTSNTAATVSKKRLQFLAAFAPFGRALLALDARHYGATPQGDADLIVEFPDETKIDPLAQAQAFSAYYAAYSASIETLVRERNPDWDKDTVDAEVKRIKEDRGLTALADPTIRLNAAGQPIQPGEPTEPDDDEGDPAAAGDPNEEESTDA